MKIKAVLFDIDGTLIPLDVGLYTTIKAAKLLGLKPPSKKYMVRETFGYTSAEYFPKLFPGKGKLTKKFIELKYKSYYEKGAVKPFKDTVKVLTSLKKKGYKIGIVSTNSKRFARFILDKICVPYDTLISLDDVKHRKPSPEPVLKACKKLGIKPEEAVFVGDQAFDMQAGKSAGVLTIGITTGRNKKSELLRAGADNMIDSLTELLSLL